MTHATTLTAFRSETSPVGARAPRFALRGERLRELPPGLKPQHLTAVSLRSKTNGGASNASPTAPRSRPSIGSRHGNGMSARASGVRPVIAIGRYSDGEIAFLLPLCVVPRRLTRRLSWLGQELCDYNAPLLARDFSERVTPERFLAAWQELQAQVQCEPRCATTGSNLRRCRRRSAGKPTRSPISESRPIASSAHLTRLGDDWEKFYRRQTLVGDAPARPHQAQTYVPVRRGSFHDRDRYRGCAADARNADGSKKPIPDAKRHCRHFRPARSSRILSRSGFESEDPASRARQPRGHRNGLRGGEFRDRISAIAITTCSRASWTPRWRVTDRACFICVNSWPTRSSVGSKRFDFTVGDEPYKQEWC